MNTVHADSLSSAGKLVERRGRKTTGLKRAVAMIAGSHDKKTEHDFVLPAPACLVVPHAIR